MTDLSNNVSALRGALRPRDSLRDRFHHWLLSRQFLAVQDDAEQYAYVLIDGKPIKHKVIEPPRLGRLNWQVRQLGSGHQVYRVSSSQIKRVTGSLDDSGLNK